uniref:Tetratricopeptide repeat protein n=1 Tax=candidate division WOR-3 bacterium TaxID=2052148 RepID=A0A7C4TGK0_UNCW3
MAMDLKKELLIRALDGKGEVLSLIGRYGEAIDSFQKVLKYSKNSHLTLAKTKRKIADVYQNQGDYEIALRTFEEAQMFLTGDTVEEQLERAEIYISRSWVYKINGEMQRAIIEAETGLKIVDEISPATIPEQTKIKHKKIKANGLNSLGVIYRTKGEYDKALELYQKDLKICEEIGDKRGIGIASNNLGVFYHDKGEYDKAIELYQKYLKISEEIADKQNIALANGNLGVANHDRGEYNKAFELYQKALKISEEIGDKKSISRTISNLGSLFLELGELKKAEEYLIDAEKSVKEISDKYLLIDVFSYIAELKIKQNLIKEASEYGNSALKLAQELDLKSGKAKALLIKARIEVADSRWQIADRRFKEAIKLFEELNQPFELAKAYYYYGECLLRRTGVREKIPRPFGKRAGVRGQEDEEGIARLKTDATEYFRKAKEIFEKIGARAWLKKVNELWSRIKKNP